MGRSHVIKGASGRTNNTFVRVRWIVMVARWVPSGPFAGVLALLHPVCKNKHDHETTTSSLAKLYFLANAEHHPLRILLNDRRQL